MQVREKWIQLTGLRCTQCHSQTGFTLASCSNFQLYFQQSSHIQNVLSNLTVHVCAHQHNDNINH